MSEYEVSDWVELEKPTTFIHASGVHQRTIQAYRFVKDRRNQWRLQTRFITNTGASVDSYYYGARNVDKFARQFIGKNKVSV